MGITAILSILSTVNSLLPEVVKLLQAVEAAFPNATVESKINEVLKVLQSLSTVENDLSSPISIITSLLGGLHKSPATPAA